MHLTNPLVKSGKEKGLPILWWAVTKLDFDYDLRLPEADRSGS